MTKPVKFFLTATIILLFVVGIITSIYLYTTGFDIKSFIISFEISTYEKTAIILCIYALRNYLLIPSTPIIILSVIMLQDFFLVTLLAIIGISIGLIETYCIGYFFRENLAKKKKFSLIEKYQNEISENGAKVIFFGAIFPSIPTDAVCYAAGFIEYNFTKFFLAAIAGELPIILLYSYLGVKAEQYMSYFFYFIGFFVVLFCIWWILKKKK